MQQAVLDRIIERSPSGRLLFYYFKDRYALMLLEDVVASGRSIAELKKSQFQPLLCRPLVRQVLSRVSDRQLRVQDLQSRWVYPYQVFRLTFGQWPLPGERWRRSWHQMARSGVNLVLQLNLPMRHICEMERLLREARGELQCDLHPIAAKPDFTLAWSRIDFDPDSKEVLIEEVQSDWVRDAVANSMAAVVDRSRWKQYVQRWLQPYRRIWSEAMLAATIAMVRSMLAPKRIFYYTFSTGNKIKRLACYPPPRSLYVDLPRRFCFRETHHGPSFLREHGARQIKRTLRDPSSKWFVMDLDLDR
ncbi:MAG: hypothetical protein P8N76_16515 [Pirellulaceae bacterium]|nr:hypothetical protein [Pirellulaceae bacterium]